MNQGTQLTPSHHNTCHHVTTHHVTRHHITRHHITHTTRHHITRQKTGSLLGRGAARHPKVRLSSQSLTRHPKGCDASVLCTGVSTGEHQASYRDAQSTRRPASSGTGGLRGALPALTSDPNRMIEIVGPCHRPALSQGAITFQFGGHCCKLPAILAHKAPFNRCLFDLARECGLGVAYVPRLARTGASPARG